MQQKWSMTKTALKAVCHAPNSKVLVLTEKRWIQALFRLALAECRSPHDGLPFSGLTAAFAPCPAAGAMYET